MARNPMARAVAHRKVSISLIRPAIVSPRIMSLTALVMARPGISSMISDIRTTSGLAAGRNTAVGYMQNPVIRDAIRLKTIVFMQKGAR